jgi:GcrA cell cycle regulator
MLPPPPTQRRTFMELRLDECRWPYGDPRDKDFRFCGGRQLDGRPYCGVHCRMAYQPLGTKRERQAA